MGSQAPAEPQADRAPPPPAARATAAFMAAVPPFATFAQVIDPDRFRAVPDAWVLGLADVVSSGEAIEAGLYKQVNMAGAAVISAVSNALGTLDFPFLFGGDGASFAVAADDAGPALDAMAATVAWVGRELGLVLRSGFIAVEAVRAAGHDVRVARFSASPDAAYAMFDGGGLRWAEAQLKAGHLAVPAVRPGAVPDLSGLSCRFRNIAARHGVMLSVLARPRRAPGDPRYRALVNALVRTVGEEAEAGRPAASFSPWPGFSLGAVALGTRLARRPGESRLRSAGREAWASLVAYAVLASGRTVGRFSPRRYMAEVVSNTDFRKYDDGLTMTLDCSEPVAAAVEALLEAAERDGTVVFGLHRQDAATVTCLVPSAVSAAHVHFVDGAAGGYAMAARSLKSRLAGSVSL